VRILGILAAVVAFHLDAMTDFERVYPPVIQTIAASETFKGDRHGAFYGDAVAVLSDGSKWKIHPLCKEAYQKWTPGDRVNVALRKDWYWFKREHKFVMYNLTRAESANVMIVGHREDGLRIATTEVYHKRTISLYDTERYMRVTPDGRSELVEHQVYCGEKPVEMRKVLVLSDGSVWVIRDHLNDFNLGLRVYIGAQGHPKKFYDFVLITGDEREAIYTMARPQK